ncbi:MAG: AAA family ATPase [Bacillota bacterium]|nr:AAA family ATPase [Bacillota bacterium]
MALISDPKVLFLDEPTMGLDPKSRKTLWSLIRYLRSKKTVFLTTHYLEEADALADRIAIIDQGRLVALGTSEELKRHLGGMQVMTVKADSLSPAAMKNLKKIYPQTAVADSHLIIKAEKLDFNKVVDLLRGEGVKINWLSMKEPTLDEIYLKSTGRTRDNEII